MVTVTRTARRGTVRIHHTLSWFLCPLIADAAGLGYLYPGEELVPRPAIRSSEALPLAAQQAREAGFAWFDDGETGVTWARLVELLANIFQELYAQGPQGRWQGVRGSLVARMDMQAHWSAQFQEQCVAHLAHSMPGGPGSRPSSGRERQLLRRVALSLRSL